MDNNNKKQDHAVNFQTIKEQVAYVGEELAEAVAHNAKLGHECCERMKEEFDRHIPIEESVIKIYDQYGPGVAMAASMEFFHWFVIERIPRSKAGG